MMTFWLNEEQFQAEIMKKWSKNLRDSQLLPYVKQNNIFSHLTASAALDLQRKYRVCQKKETRYIFGDKESKLFLISPISFSQVMVYKEL